MQISWFLTMFILAAVACGPVSGPVTGGPAVETPPPAPSPTPVLTFRQPTAAQTLKGTFTAPRFQDGPRPLQAVFTPSGQDERWEVVFNFRFDGAQHAYRGTAEGSLENGPLRGTVQSRQRRTFTFAGEFNNGVFRGQHAETTPGRSGRGGGGGNTGTLTFK